MVDARLAIAATDCLGQAVCVTLTPSNVALVLLVACAALPLMASHFYGSFRLVFGTLYPAYASYKAVSTKNVKEYVKWMMYWIVFAFFTCAETFTDILLAFWFPFYYEIKIILVIWLLSPVTKGSSILYRKFVHPQLAKHEAEIDSYILRAKQQGYNTVFKLGVNGLNFARDLIVQAALTGRVGIVEQLKRSYSLNDITSETDGGYMTSNRRAITLTGGEIPPREDVDEIMDSDRRTVDVFYDSDPDTADGPTVSSGYSSAQDVMIAATAAAAPEASGSSSSSTTNVRQRTTRNSQKTSSRKSSTNAENAIYATLPRSSKRTSRKKIIPDFGI